MTKITTTHVYKINGRLVVAENIIDAINIYREDLSPNYSIDDGIKSVVIVEDDNIPPSNSALIREKK